LEEDVLTYKWVLSNYSDWYFIEYNSPEDFIGWVITYFSSNKKLQMYVSDTPSIFKSALRWRLGNVKITNSYPKNLKKSQWSKFSAVNKRNFQRQMMQDIFN